MTVSTVTRPKVFVTGPRPVLNEETYSDEAKHRGCGLRLLMSEGFMIHLPLWWFPEVFLCETTSLASVSKMDEIVLSDCKFLVQLPGRSAVADRDASVATRFGVSVFHSITKLAETHGKTARRERSEERCQAE